MAKVFTITEGLETLGAMKSGGQGSVYKGQRTGTIFTAIKILPTPILEEAETNKNIVAFKNEVQKLQKVNEAPNPNVVKFISSGITQTGNLPYIEMEFIDGPDLEELLKPPHHPIFTVKEVLKVAEHLAHALAHCHNLDIKHGDVKSNNVKYNSSTGNYVLLDFGLAIMSEEQRRTSLRHAGAIEFMAPEQNDGQMLFQTDVYSYGVILFELLAGRVPFPLNDNTETARNAVRLAHLEQKPPDLLQLRQQKTAQLPVRALHEGVPDWLVAFVYKCLEKDPQQRFANGGELYGYFCQQTVNSAGISTFANAQFNALQDENNELRRQIDELQQKLAQKPKTKVGKSIAIAVLAVAVLVLGFWFFIPGTKQNTTTVQKANTAAPTLNTPVNTQLQVARQFLAGGKMVEALTIYSSYARKNVAEAQYMYGLLALQNKNKNINCNEAFELLQAAAAQNLPAAKATLGFLFSNAKNTPALKREDLYQRCQFTANTQTGATLLIEAMLQGDTSASRYLSELKLPR